MSDWQLVGHDGDVKPGQIVQVMVDGEPVALANVDGELLAIGDICSHEYVELHEGWMEGDEVECPMHGSKFSLRDGCPRGLPATKPVPAYEVKLDGGDIYIRGPVKAA